MERFNYNATTVGEAKSYMFSRAKQLLKYFYKLKSITEYSWGIEAFFEKDKIIYQSVYIFPEYRGKGLFKTLVKNTILTSYECGLEDFLIIKNIPYVCVNLTQFKEYRIISDFYGNQKTKRSNVELMNHIDEGLFILEQINASETAKKAYCLHPIVQGDEDLKQNSHLLEGLQSDVIITAVEYRSVANEYLSLRSIYSANEIRLSSLRDVNDMLIADKIQNRKDFDLYHKGTHPRSKELDIYFKNWFQRLSIKESTYKEMVNFLL